MDIKEHEFAETAACLMAALWSYCMIAGTGDWGRFGLLVGNLFADDLDLMSYIHVPWQVRLIE